MKNNLLIIGLSVTFLGTIATAALAAAVPSVQPDNGFLQQPDPTFMDAPAIPKALFPTLTQEIRAADLLIHEVDRLPIGSPEYQHAHRRLVQNLNMMQRQLHFNPVDLARFNATTHPDIFNQTVYPFEAISNAPGSVATTFVASPSPDTIVYAGRIGTSVVRTYVGDRPTRRSIVEAVNEQNRLRLLSLAL